jgi:hypothetical protein
MTIRTLISGYSSKAQTDHAWLERMRPLRMQASPLLPTQRDCNSSPEIRKKKINHQGCCLQRMPGVTAETQRAQRGQGASPASGTLRAAGAGRRRSPLAGDGSAVQKPVGNSDSARSSCTFVGTSQAFLRFSGLYEASTATPGLPNACCTTACALPIASKSCRVWSLANRSSRAVSLVGPRARQAPPWPISVTWKIASVTLRYRGRIRQTFSGMPRRGIQGFQ